MFVEKWDNPGEVWWSLSVVLINLSVPGSDTNVGFLQVAALNV